jgi:hypothetical protein
MARPAPDSVKRLVGRFDQNRKVLLSPDCIEEKLPEANSPHEQESLKRTSAADSRASPSEPDDLDDQEVSEWRT